LDRERAQLIDIGNFITSKDKDARLFGILLVRDMGDKASGILIKSILELANKDPNEEVALAATQVAQQAKPVVGVSSSAPSAPDAALLPRVFFHIQSEDQRDSADAIGQGLERIGLKDSGIVMPGVQLIPSGPQSSQLRYFRRSEAAEADAIATVLNTQYPTLGIKAQYIPGYENSTNIRKRHYEVWFGPQPLPTQGN